MLLEKQKVSNARIEVEQSFCDFCSADIKKTLQEIDAISNIRLYPNDLLITFNFTSPYKLSVALNALSEIGYYEKGEIADNQTLKVAYCCCERIF